MPNDPTVRIPLKEIPVKVENVHVSGIKRTSSKQLLANLKSIFDASNFEQLVSLIKSSKDTLSRTGIFKKVDVYIDVHPEKSNDPDKKSYDVRFDVVEEKYVKGGVSSLIGTNEGSLLFNLNFPNLFGCGESLTFDYSFGSKNTSGFGSHLKLPLFYNPDWHILIAALKYGRDFPWNGTREKTIGPSIGLEFPSAIGQHSLKYEGFWNMTECLDTEVSLGIREFAGHRFKSAICHTLKRDLRDNPILPTNGSLLQTKQEFAGLGGDVKFIKHSIDFHYIRSLIYNTALHFSLSSGVLKNFDKPSLSDRFYLGGPLTLRGFTLNGAGNQENGYSLGIESYIGSSLNLYTPLPFTSGDSNFSKAIKLHYFANVASVGNITKISSLWDNLRGTYGLGVVMNLSNMARIEMNYCLPLRAKEGDRIVHGFQFGIGMEYW